MENVPASLAVGVKRFNQRALDLTQPGARWPLSAVRIGALMLVLGLLSSVLPDLVLYALGPTHVEASVELSAAKLVSAVVAAPMVETLLLALVYRLIRTRLGLTGFVLVMAGLAAAAHATARNPVPIAASVAFIVMSYEYESFRTHIDAERAVVGVMLSHATANGIIMAVLLPFLLWLE